MSIPVLFIWDYPPSWVPRVFLQVFSRKISPKEIQENYKQSHKNSKNYICLGIYNSRLKPKILTEMIAKHCLIIGYYM